MKATITRITRGAEGGQAIVWAAVMLPLFLAVVGLAIDGGIVFDNQRALQDVADSAARAGAMQIDQQIYRASSGETIVLDQTAAQQVAVAYASSQGTGITATVTTDAQHVIVMVNRSIPTGFLGIVGMTTVQISATATAEVQHGITSGRGT